MNRRLTILLPLTAAALTAGCTTFSDNDAIARVDDVELSSEALRERADAQGAPRDEALDGDAVRQEITVWIDEQLAGPNDPVLAARAYPEGLLASGSICIAVLVVDTAEAADATLAELRGGADFDTVFQARNVDPSIAADNGDLGCLPARELPLGSDNRFVDSLLDLNGANPFTSVELPGNPGDPLLWAVTRFVPFEELGPDETPIIVENLTTTALDIDVHVDPRYGTYDASTGVVVPLG